MKTKILKTIGKFFKFIGKWALRKLAFLGIIAALTIGGISSCAPSFGAPKVATVSAYAETVTPAQVSDLTGTTWSLYIYPMTFLQSIESFDIFGEINYTINSTQSTLNIGSVMITQYYISFYEIDTGANAITTQYNSRWSLYNDNSETATPINDIRLTISTGTDVTNATLITWLEDNATLISGDSNPTFIADGVEYEYEYGMTFYDWIQSEYNINNFTSWEGELSYQNLTFVGLYDNGYRIIVSGVPIAADISQITQYSNILYPTQVYMSGYLFGYREGYDAGGGGYLVGYDAGYEDGYDAGYEDGYDAGYEDGYDVAPTIGQSIWDNMFIFIRALFDALIDLLSVEILPNVTVGLVTVGIPMAFWAVGAIIRLVTFFFGGGA